MYDRAARDVPEVDRAARPAGSARTPEQATVLRLQQAAGNRAVNALLQRQETDDDGDLLENGTGMIAPEEAAWQHAMSRLDALITVCERHIANGAPRRVGDYYPEISAIDMDFSAAMDDLPETDRRVVTWNIDHRWWVEMWMDDASLGSEAYTVIALRNNYPRMFRNRFRKWLEREPLWNDPVDMQWNEALWDLNRLGQELEGLPDTNRLPAWRAAQFRRRLLAANASMWDVVYWKDFNIGDGKQAVFEAWQPELQQTIKGLNYILEPLATAASILITLRGIRARQQMAAEGIDFPLGDAADPAVSAQ